MEPVIDARRSALINFKRDPSERNKTALRVARNKAQQTARHCANNYWLQLCQSIQTSSDTGNIRGMYDGIKKATSPTIKRTLLLSAFPIRGRHSRFSISSCSYLLYHPPSLQPQPCPLSPHPLNSFLLFGLPCFLFPGNSILSIILPIYPSSFLRRGRRGKLANGAR